MADLTVTPANVQPGALDQIDKTSLAGTAINAGDVVYKDAATGRWLLADNNSPTVAARTPGGIALNTASNGQPLAVHKGGDMTPGATLAPGVAYYLSDTPGKICPVADLATGEFPSIIGIAKSTTVLSVGLNSSGVSL
jgi:hypothetical protein